MTTLHMASSIISLLDMPNELFLNIVQHVDASGLKALCLTSQHLRSLAQGFLTQIAILSPSKIWKLVDTLVTRPEFAKGFTQLRLGPMSQETHNEMKRYSKYRIAALTNVTKDAYRKCLRKAYGAKENRRILQTGMLFKDNPTSIGLALLFALAPDMRSISIGTGSLESIPLLANVFDSEDAAILPAKRPELHRLVQTHLQDRIETLTVFHEEVIIRASPTSRSPTQYYNRFTLDVRLFHNLKHLAVPFWLITYTPGMPYVPSTSAFLPCRNLPSSLVSLRTVHTNRWQMLGVAWIDDLISNEKYFCNLAIVKMVFHSSFWQTASLFASNEGLALNAVPALDRWSESRVALEMLFDYVIGRLGSGANVLARAIEKCRGESLTELFKDPEIFAEIGIRGTTQ